MSERREHILICDQCGSKKADNGQTYYGGHPFHGWYQVLMYNGSTQLSELQKKHSYDFCSKDCMLLHYQQTTQHENK